MLKLLGKFLFISLLTHFTLPFTDAWDGTEALRNAPCLYKVWTYILLYKIQGPFFLLCNSIPAVRTLGLGRGCAVGLEVAWSWLEQYTNMWTASWGRSIFSLPSASTRPREEKKTNCLALQEGHKHQSIPALLFLWKTSFICVGTVPHSTMHLQAYISLSISKFISLCTFQL